MDDGFDAERERNIRALGAREDLKKLSNRWLIEVSRNRYSYNFTWMGLPIIQFPQDIVAMQEIIWSVRPDLIIETGIARGGSLAYYASLLELLGGEGRVLGIDVDIREGNRRALEAHPMIRRISLLEGSSTDPEIFAKAEHAARGARVVLVLLDSHHTHAHVLRELDLYSALVSVGSYLVVFDTIVEDMPEDFYPDRPWGPGDNPKTAVREFLAGTKAFEIDRRIEDKLQVTVAPSGYLRRVAE